jgi:hypothetical protein
MSSEEKILIAIAQLGSSESRAKTCPMASSLARVEAALDPTPGNGGWVLADLASIHAEIRSLLGWRQWIMGGMAILGGMGGLGAIGYALSQALGVSP